GSLAIVSLAVWWLIRSPWGRAFMALRENPLRAQSLGIDTRRYTLMAFAIGSALGGIAGALYAPLTQYIDPVPFNLSLSLDLLMMVIVGGAGFFLGPFLGAMIAVLEVTNIKKNFGGISAVADVSFDVREGEILGLIGPNGCGKSTLFNCILGQLTPSGGEVKLDGKVITGLRPAELNKLGVSRTFQLLQVFPKLSVRENLILAGQEHQGNMASRLVGRSDAGL